MRNKVVETSPFRYDAVAGKVRFAKRGSLVTAKPKKVSLSSNTVSQAAVVRRKVKAPEKASLEVKYVGALIAAAGGLPTIVGETICVPCTFDDRPKITAWVHRLGGKSSTKNVYATHYNRARSGLFILRVD